MKFLGVFFVLTTSCSLSAGADIRSTDFPTISEAVAACGVRGGRVVVPAGVWETGPVCLKSNVELHLEEGAVLRFVDDPNAYLPAVRVAWEGVECYNLSPLVYAYAATNIAITGKGMIEPKMGFWRNWFGTTKPTTRKIWNKLVFEWGGNDVPVESRPLWSFPDSAFRPQLIHFNNCRDVRLDGFTIRGTPFWTIHLYCCDMAIVKDLDVSAFPADGGQVANNSDGIDIEASSNIHVVGCSFRQGDDAIVIKSGRNRDGRRVGRPSENVLVEACTVYAGHVLLGIGSELSGGVRNVTLRNCRVEGEARRLLFIKTNRLRGGFVENIRLENVIANKVTQDILAVITSYPGEAGATIPEGLQPTPISSILVSNVVCKSVGAVVNVWGDPRSPVCGVSIRDARVGTLCGNVGEIENATDVVMDGIRIKRAPSKPLRPEHW